MHQDVIQFDKRPRSFPAALYNLLNMYKWNTCLFYLDDVIIFSNTVEDHISNVDEILTTLHEAVVSLKINKCHSFQQ